MVFRHFPRLFVLFIPLRQRFIIALIIFRENKLNARSVNLFCFDVIGFVSMLFMDVLGLRVKATFPIFLVVFFVFSSILLSCYRVW